LSTLGLVGGSVFGSLIWYAWYQFTTLFFHTIVFDKAGSLASKGPWTGSLSFA